MTLKIIAGKFKGRLLKTPKGPSTRPTQGMLRAAVFNICQHVVNQARFLDLYAGSGAMSFEALSRGAASATLVEQSKAAIACIQANIDTLQLTSATLIPTDAARAMTLMAKQGAQFDLVYIDPPYDTPFTFDPLIPLLAPHATLFFEERYQPKKAHKSPGHPRLQLKDTRRFGSALLSIFYFLPQTKEQL